MEGHIDGFATIERHRGQVLIEKRFEHDDFVTLLQEGGEDGVLA